MDTYITFHLAKQVLIFMTKKQVVYDAPQEKEYVLSRRTSNFRLQNCIDVRWRYLTLKCDDSVKKTDTCIWRKAFFNADHRIL